MGASLPYFRSVKSVSSHPSCVLVNNLDSSARETCLFTPMDLCSQPLTYISPTHGVYFSLWIIAQSHFISLVSVSASTFRSFFSCHGAHHGGDVSTSHFGGVAGASHSPCVLPPHHNQPFLQGACSFSWRQAPNEGNFWHCGEGHRSRRTGVEPTVLGLEPAKA